MTEPAVSARRFCIACLLGALLGLYYGFLRPLRPRHKTLSDLLFLPGLLWTWIYLAFAVCRGDIRLWHTAGLLGGCFLWDRTAGMPLRPVFSRFWQVSPVAGAT